MTTHARFASLLASLLAACAAEVNHAPEVLPLGRTTVQPGDPIAVTIDATDPDGDTLTLTLALAGAPEGATLTGTTLAWTPAETDVGEHELVVAVTDDGVPPLTSYTVLGVTVLGPSIALNHPPAFLPIADRSADAGASVEVALSAVDPDGDALSFAIVEAPAGVTLNASTLSWQPALGDVGSHWIAVSVTDDGEPPLVAHTSFTVTVVDPSAPGINHPPVAEPVRQQSVRAGGTLTLALSAEDPDAGDALAWSALELPAGATLDASTVTWTPAESDAGTHWARLRVTDNGVPPLHDTILVRIDVVVPGSGNLPPAFLSVPAPGTAEECVPFTASFEALDPEGAALTYLSPNLPDGATLEPEGSTAVLEWTPARGQEGAYTIAIYAVDDGAPAAAEVFVYTIQVAPPTGTITARFDDRGTSSTPALEIGELSVTGSADLYLLNLNGLGIVGGYNNNTIDGSEWVDYAFAYPTRGVSYLVSSAGNLDGDGTVGDARLEAFDASDVSLGTRQVNGAGSIAVSSAFGDVPISRFRVTAEADSHRTATVSYRGCAPAPPPP